MLLVAAAGALGVGGDAGIVGHAGVAVRFAVAAANGVVLHGADAVGVYFSRVDAGGLLCALRAGTGEETPEQKCKGSSGEFLHGEASKVMPYTLWLLLLCTH